MNEKDFIEYVNLSELTFSYKDILYCAQASGRGYLLLVNLDGEEKEQYFDTVEDLLQAELMDGTPLIDALGNIDW